MPLPAPKAGRMAPGALAKRIPKIHLHCHLEGTLRPATFVELAAKHGVGLRYRPSNAGGEPGSQGDPADPYRFEGMGEFLYLFAAVSRSLREPSDYARLAAEFVDDALAQGVIYGELDVYKRQQYVVHDAPRPSGRPDHSRRQDRHVRDARSGRRDGQPLKYRARPRWSDVVHRIQSVADRPDHHRRHDRRVL